MKKVTSQNIGIDGLMMDFTQIQNKLKEFYQGDELFIVVAENDEHFIQVCQPLINDIFEIQMRINENDNVKFCEKAVVGFDELERYFKAYYQHEDWLFEEFKTWVDVSEYSRYNVQKISNNQYIKKQLNHSQIIDILSHVKANDILLLSNVADDYFFKIYVHQTGNRYQYSLEIKHDNHNYCKIVNDFEMVKDIVSQSLIHSKIDLKAWQSLQ